MDNPPLDELIEATITSFSALLAAVANAPKVNNDLVQDLRFRTRDCADTLVAALEQLGYKASVADELDDQILIEIEASDATSYETMTWRILDLNSKNHDVVVARAAPPQIRLARLLEYREHARDDFWEPVHELANGELPFTADVSEWDGHRSEIEDTLAEDTPGWYRVARYRMVGEVRVEELECIGEEWIGGDLDVMD